MTIPAETRTILEAGARAVSPYNIQPWRFRAAGDAVDIYIIRTKNFFLKLRGVSPMTLGFLLENLEEGARGAGKKLEVEILGHHLNLDRPIARVRFVPGGPPADIAPVLSRRTNRYPYSPSPLAGAPREAVARLLSDLSNGPCAVKLLEGEEKDTMSHILADLEGVRFSNVKLLSEAVEYVRETPAENARHRDRLDVETLALSPRDRWGLRLFRDWPSLRGPVCWGLARRAASDQRRLFDACAGIAVFSVADEDYRAYIELGRRVQRLLNGLARAGLDSHPILGGFYLLHLVFENPEIFSAREKDVLLTCGRDIEILTETPHRRISFLLRLGAAEKPAPESLRKPLEALVLP